jgi:hypothetical protein
MAKQNEVEVFATANLKVRKSVWARFGQYCDRNNYQKLGKAVQILEDALEAEMRRDDGQ